MTTTSYKKKLIEVAMPLEAINKASVREKSIHVGHPSTLHLYWARRPLATCRAVLFAQLVDDPSAHPDKFPTEAEQTAERERLFRIIEELVIWENSTNEEVLKKAHAEIRKSFNGELPPIHDPFSGGGSIPLEAQRLGLPAYGSDLNPVAVMIGKAMIEIPSLFKDMKPIHPGGPDKMHYKNAEGLAEDVKYYGEWIRKKAFERIGHFYPQVELPTKHGGGKANVIAWIWAKTVPSPDPALNGLHVPLVRSFDLFTRKGQEAWVEPIIANQNYRFEIRTKAQGHQRHNLSGTISRQGGVCVVSGNAIPLKYIRNMGKSGKIGCRLLAVVAEGPDGKCFLSPDDFQEKKYEEVIRPEIEDIQMPQVALGFRVQAYGVKTFGELFNDRQALALKTLQGLILSLKTEVKRDFAVSSPIDDDQQLRSGGSGATAYAEAISLYLSFVISKVANLNSSLTRWRNDNAGLGETFGRQAVSMVWDFAEPNIFSSSAGNLLNPIKRISDAISYLAIAENKGTVFFHDAQSVAYQKDAVISTDPPYYDNIGYADLSDFFFTWLRPALKEIYPEIFSLMATPKTDELVAKPYMQGGKDGAEEFFTNGMKSVVQNMAQNTSMVAPATIYYAFKQSEIEQHGISSTGWATFLQAVIEAGYAVVGTWPMRTEMATRMRGLGSNALANSVVLVCRRREAALGKITRAEFIRQLKTELPSAIADLKAANISPADIPQSSIGPGIGIFSRYQAVMEADDSPMTVKTALQLINRELGQEDGDYDAETSFALTWFEQNGFNVGDFGTANNLATAKGIAVNALVNAGIAQASGGKFGLFNRDSLEEGWDPADDSRVTIWECCQYLIRRLENRGEFEAAKLMKAMGSERAEAAKELAYALYDIAANKRKDANEATAYNGLIAVWSELSMQAANVTDTDMRGDRQGQLI